MKIGVCGIACEKCPRMARSTCPSEETGCRPRENPFCAVATCACRKGVALCSECAEFPCETTKSGPIAFDYCCFIVGEA